MKVILKMNAFEMVYNIETIQDVEELITDLEKFRNFLESVSSFEWFKLIIGEKESDK